MAVAVVTIRYGEYQSVLDVDVVRDVMRRGQRVLNRARELCPIDTGRLKASLTLELRRVDGVPVAVVGTNLVYGIYVESGTGIYVGRPRIKPRSASVLRWPAVNNSGVGNRRYSGGSTARYVFAKSVAGRKATPFLEPALDAAVY